VLVRVGLRLPRIPLEHLFSIYRTRGSLQHVQSHAQHDHCRAIEEITEHERLAPCRLPTSSPGRASERAVRALGKTLGLSLRHLEKLEERQGQIENSAGRAISDKSFK
jgi:hypothetical protein